MIHTYLIARRLHVAIQRDIRYRLNWLSILFIMQSIAQTEASVVITIGILYALQMMQCHL